MGVVEFNTTLPASTDARLRFYTSTNTSDIISESDLPGNTAGFASRFIDLSALDPATYPKLAVGVTLNTTDTSVTPVVEDISLGYIETRNMLSGTALNLRGNKVIGSDALAVPVHKYDQNHTTNGSGQINLTDIEWDSYVVTLAGGAMIREACLSNPYSLSPNAEALLRVSTAPASTNNLRVEVVDTVGSPVIEATVALTGPINSTADTSWCGQVYFGSLTAGDYDLEVSAPGLTTQTIGPLSVSGAVVERVVLVP